MQAETVRTILAQMPDNEPNSNPEAPQSVSSRTRSVSLKNLFLDPNNYRFVDHEDYLPVPPENIPSEEVQRRTTSFLLGDSTDGIRDLLTSFRKNGWLPIDQIQVRELSKGKFLVVEGNRRVAALKYLQRRHEESAVDLGALSSDFFSAVPVVIYEEASAAQHLVVMGLAHIAGKKKWPPLNQARALRELITKHGWSEDDTRQALGIEKRDLRRALGALALADAYAASEFGDQMTTMKYNLFREIVASPALRSWIDWDQTSYRAGRPENLERLFAWVSKEATQDEDDQPANNHSTDPAISTGEDVRELARIISDESALRELDESRRLSVATFSSRQVVESKLGECVSRINDSVGVLFNHVGKLTDDHLASIEEVQRKLRGLLSSRDRQPVLLGAASERTSINASRQGHFKSISLERYRRFSHLQIDGLRRVNLFVGANNAGKTSLLEAVQLLACQNDVSAILEIAQRRGKLHDDPPPGWLKEQIATESRLSGKFDEVSANQASVQITNRINGGDVEDKTGYVTTIEITADYGGILQRSVTHLFERRERITRYATCRVLCPVVFSSPFTQHNTTFLASLFAKSVEAGVKKDVVSFIQERIDSNLKDIDQTTAPYSRNFTRFLVEHEAIRPAPDISQFGEGLQRIFQIGLLFAYAKDGVVLIDEFENAIHFSLLRSFSRLVQELAVRFNVQVFITSHSKECLDAFVQNDFLLSDVAAYALRVTSAGETQCYRYPGEQLETLLESVDIDLRA
jgi:predicted ATPase